MVAKGFSLQGSFSQQDGTRDQRTHRAGRCVCQDSAPTQERSQRKGGRSKGPRTRMYKSSDGRQHLGSALEGHPRPFPGPPKGDGPPLRILPIGGLGEIGMNCMLVGVHDRYILIDAGLMFPDFQDLAMNKILPDVSFLAQWKDKIEAVIITHGHEDHIGAMPWVVPALDPSTRIYAGPFAYQLVKRRLMEFSLWEGNSRRIKPFKMGDTFPLGPFSCEPIRVTHSIPDCCGLILRSDHGTIVHTGDWKIDEHPVDGQVLDRTLFEKVGREGVTLMMSDSTNILSPGRGTSERDVEQALMRRVLGHAGKGRVLTTQFASNVHRLGSVKKAADAAGRKLCFIGMSLNTYLEAAALQGQAPFNPRDLIQPAELNDYDPSQVMIVTTGSQGEPRAALSLASQDASPLLKLDPSDLLLYSAKVIPGNDTSVMQLMNRISSLGVDIALGRDENLHTSGHAYKEELREVLQLVKPQHFLPVHGESAFLYAHAQLGRETGIKHTSVIKNGQMLGVSPLRTGNSHGGVSGMSNLGKVQLRLLYNDGANGTGTNEEMAIAERNHLATEGLVIAAVDVDRSGSSNGPSSRGSSSDTDTDISDEDFSLTRMQGNVRVTTRAMWQGNGALQSRLHKAASLAVQRLPSDASLRAVEHMVANAIKRESKAFNKRRPEVIVIANESDPRLAQQILAQKQEESDQSGDEGYEYPSRRESRGKRGAGQGRSRQG